MISPSTPGPARLSGLRLSVSATGTGLRRFHEASDELVDVDERIGKNGSSGVDVDGQTHFLLSHQVKIFWNFYVSRAKRCFFSDCLIDTEQQIPSAGSKSSLLLNVARWVQRTDTTD